MSAVLTPEQRAEWREDVTTCESRLVDRLRILVLLDALDAAEAGAAEQVTAALAEVERRIETKLGITSRALRVVRDYHQEVRS